MNNIKAMVIAAKCAPEREKLSFIQRAGIRAVELYLSREIMSNLEGIISVCKSFPFRYAVHAPNDDYNPEKLAGLVKAIRAEVIVFHEYTFKSKGELFNISKTDTVIEEIKKVGIIDNDSNR